MKQLRADPRQAVLADAYAKARKRWHKAYLDGTHPCNWIPWRESLARAWQHTLDNLETDMTIPANIQESIDNYIYDCLADINKTPRHVGRGAKHQQRSTIKAIDKHGYESEASNKPMLTVLDETEDVEEEARLGWIRQRLETHAARTQWVIDRIKEPKLKLAVEMARDYMPPAAIRERTGLRIPDLQAGFDKWLFILRVAA